MKNLKKKFLFFFQRCYVLYAAVILLLVFFVDYRILAMRTLNQYKDMPSYLVDFAKGQANYSDRSMRDTIRYYQHLLELFPNSAEVHGALGFCYYNRGNLKKALGFFKKAIQEQGEYFGWYYNMGIIYWRLEMYAEAMQSFESAIKGDLKKTLLYPNVVAPFELRQKAQAFDESFESRVLVLKHATAICYKGIILSSQQKKNEKDLPQSLYFYVPLRQIVVNGVKQFVFL